MLEPRWRPGTFGDLPDKDAPIRNGEMAVGGPGHRGEAVVWLDETRGHEAQVLAKVRDQRGERDTDGLHEIPAGRRGHPGHWTARRGEDTLSVTATCCATT